MVVPVAGVPVVVLASLVSVVSLASLSAVTAFSPLVTPLVATLERLLGVVVAVDTEIAAFVAAVRHPLATKAFTSATGLGSATAALVFLGVCHLAGWRRELRVGAVALVVTGVVVASLMALVGRPFPAQPVCVTDGGLAAHSFPSGHAAAVTVYAALARRSRHLPFAPVAVLAAVVAVSRVYLGTHYASDTVVGVAVGLAAVALARRVVEWRAGVTAAEATPGDD